MRTAEESLEMAKEILNQMGGTKLLTMMIGAKSFRYDQNYVGFRHMYAERSKSNYVQIELMPSDLYKIDFYNIRGLNSKITETIEGVYAEDLARIFSDSTGLTLSIPKIEIR